MTAPVVRPIRADELPALLDLYRHLNADDPPVPLAAAQQQWDDIRMNRHLHYLAAEADGRLAATCTMAVIPNLTRAMRPYALIENVVTHPDYRRRGLGRAVLQHAQSLAWAQGCYKVMLLTGSKSEATLRFYEAAGFARGIKTGFIARPPAA